MPISIVEDEGFLELIKCLDPNFKVPSKTYFMKSIMPDMFSELTNLLKQKIDNSWAISLTTDSCTSRATASYTTITAHVMDKDFQLESFVL